VYLSNNKNVQCKIEKMIVLPFNAHIWAGFF